MMKPYIVRPSGAHNATLIFLHGLGDESCDWAKSLACHCQDHIKIILPRAKKMIVSVNHMFMASWFNMPTSDLSGEEDVDGIITAAEFIHKYIDMEICTGVIPERIMLGGFSQGGALALYSALTYPYDIGGCVVLSGWLPLMESFPVQLKCSPDLPIQQYHGDKDSVVPYAFGKASAKFLSTFMCDTCFRTVHGLDHETSNCEMNKVRVFIHDILPSTIPDALKEQCCALTTKPEF